ncbi:MAG: EAL domain-containing protein [Halanaerobiales bacterium]
MEKQLREALKEEQFYVVFQPQYDCNLDYIRGFEVLTRWKSPAKGLIHPNEFFPVAEKTGLVVELGKWILETALERFINIQKKGCSGKKVAINISISQIIEPSFLSTVKNILNGVGFEAGKLELEVTESIFVSYPGYVMDVLKQLNTMGISISLDDFGSGYAPWSYLQNIPFEILKIDKKYIGNLQNEGNTAQIIEQLIIMAHQLGLEVLAEGVEQRRQLEILKNINCDYFQGFLVGPPVVEEKIDKYITGETV